MLLGANFSLLSSSEQPPEFDSHHAHFFALDTPMAKNGINNIYRSCIPMLFPIRAVVVLGLGAGPGRAKKCDCTTPAPTAEFVTSSPTATKEETRTIAIKNRCSFDVDLGFTGGFAGSAPCDDNQEENVGGDRCFWSLDLPDLLEAGEETLVEINGAENDVVWSGAIYGIKSPYKDNACQAGCSSSKGPSGTVTLSEFTMLANPTLAYYDISLIHGANIPQTFGPTNAASRSKDPYRNGMAGADCSWRMEPPEEYRKYLIEVKNAHGSCLQDDQCEAGEVCGASLEGDTPVYGTCGELFGFLNAHTNCIEGSQGFPFFCEMYHDLYGCSGKYSESGYSQSVTSVESVCGCSDYGDLGIPSSFPCINSNPLWVEKALPWIEYGKKGCPSSYGFPFDDSTSTFTSDDSMFELTFCPGDSEESFYG